jgi:hypothetical protein
MSVPSWDTAYVRDVDLAKVIVLPRPRTETIERDLGHVTAAIELVRRGDAARVRITGLPDAADIASLALARAQAAGVGFAAERDAFGLTLTIGPRSARP